MEARALDLVLTKTAEQPKAKSSYGFEPVEVLSINTSQLFSEPEKIIR